jgi:prolyl-tRNA synthetase
MLTRTVKAIAVMHDDAFTLLLIRGDHTLNEVKVGKLPSMDPFRFASDDEVERFLGCRPGYIGPVGVDRAKVRVIADRTVAAMDNFVCGANEAEFHLTGVNWGRDLPEADAVADIRNVVAGDASPDGRGNLALCRGIEVGHIFQLRRRYAEALQCKFLDEQGKERIMEMGCYGIGVTRIVGAAIEQGNDERGIVFPAAIAPFELVIVPMGAAKSLAVREAADKIYSELRASAIDVILDDRDERPGSMLADWELIGIPYRIVVGERGLKEGVVEFQGRRDAQAAKIPIEEIAAKARAALCV